MIFTNELYVNAEILAMVSTMRIGYNNPSSCARLLHVFDIDKIRTGLDV